MPTTFKIDPDEVYDTGAVVLGLDLPSSTLARARRAGSLRYSRKGRRVFYMGQWLLDWLTCDTSNPQEVVRA
jgi:hypothetical protein